MGEAAVACAKAVGYVGAGTVEFLVDSVTNDFYFCEMNTRLQVEHPVTEMITGVDLVEWQLRIAAGQPLPLSQEQILDRAAGCAIEARIYAENPVNDFLPQTGHIYHLRTPVDKKGTAVRGSLSTLADVVCTHADSGTTGAVVENRGIGVLATEDGIRVDSGIIAGNSISAYYDPMISKLIAYGSTREEALGKLERALRDYQVAGLQNNIDFLVKCVRHPGFTHGQPTTAFFDEHITGILEVMQDPASDGRVGRSTALSLVAIAQAQAMTCNNTENENIWSGRDNTLGLSGFRMFNSSQLSDIIGVKSLYSEGPMGTITQEARGNQEWAFSCGDTDPTVVRLVSMESCEGSVPGHSWDIAAEVNGVLTKGTVCVHANNMQDMVVDCWLDGQVGEQSYPFPAYYPSQKACGRWWWWCPHTLSTDARTGCQGSRF